MVLAARTFRLYYLCLFLLGAFPMGSFAEEYIGLVHSEREIALSMGVGGVVTALNVARGQLVQENEVLLSLDDRLQIIELDRRKVVYEDMSEIRATEDRVRAMKSMYEATRSVFERTGSISKDEMTRLEVEYSAARGRLEQLAAQKVRERLEYEGALHEKQMRQLVAPAAGVITKIEPKVGEWAKPGDTLMELVDASNCYLKTNVPLRSIRGLRVGMRIPVRFESAANTAPVEGRIAFLSTVADPASGLVELRIAFANPALRVRPGIKGIINLSDNGSVK